MTDIYLFDVDGTITPPRQQMNENFSDYFRYFAQHQKVFLVSGSDYEKIREQVPGTILDLCCGVFGCSGAEYFERGNLVYRRSHEFPPALLTEINALIERSPYETRTGNHVEHRPGMLNMSVVGRNADFKQRSEYHQWDMQSGERQRFAQVVADRFEGYEASCGGEISIDIVPAGWNKSVVKHEVLSRYPGCRLVFFGDRMGQHGNDRPLADVLNTPSARHKAIEVRNYKDTWIHLRHISQSETQPGAGMLETVEGAVACATIH